MADAHNTPEELGKQADHSEGSEAPQGPQEPRGPIGAFGATLRECLLHPLRFFQRVAESEDRWEAMGFAVLMHVLGFSFAAIWKAILEPEEMSLALIRVIIAPLWVFVSVWLGSEIMHWWLGVLGVQRASRSVTHRAVAYCYATAVLGVIPFAGIQLGLLAAIVYHVMALKQVHGTQLWKAYLAVILTWCLVIGGVSLLFLIEGAGEPEVVLIVKVIWGIMAGLVAITGAIAFIERRRA